MPPSTTDDDARNWLLPQWPAPARVRSLSTLRTGGVSQGAWGLVGGAAGGWNLGAHCGDVDADVVENRRRLRRALPSDPVWLEQVHGVEVLDADRAPACEAGVRPRADAAVTARAGTVLAVLTADCLPVLLTDRAGSAVGLAHAGWRGLAAGVVERTVEALERIAGPGRWMAWLGPAIGPSWFEVGEDVLEAFVRDDPQAARSFAPAGAPGKWLADLFALARSRLARAGVSEVYGGGVCTASDARRFYSFRRDRVTGRMASLIWID